jgi:hypothetical protein
MQILKFSKSLKESYNFFIAKEVERIIFYVHTLSLFNVTIKPLCISYSYFYMYFFL